ncbi:MAG: CHASE2 domain-containing protein, partial [Cyanobacteria bacterium J06598_3]
AFSRGESFFLAVREAREKLQALEDHYPCASWLPTIFQNPAEASPHWNALLHRDVPGRSFKRRMSDRVETLSAPIAATHKPRRAILLGTHFFVIALLIGLKSLGLFQGLELKAIDQFMRARLPETPDPRLVVITITPEDIRLQDDEERRGSLSDPTLLKLLNKLETLEPRVIGLDIYRDFSVRANLPELVTKLENTPNLFAVCKSGYTPDNSTGIPGPPEVPANQVGFSDFLVDPDGIIRRQLLSLIPEVASLCGATYSLNALLALKYLESEGYAIATSEEGYLQVGEVVFPPLAANAGGYQNIHDGGHQLLLNYRSLPDPEQIADRLTLRELLDGTVNPAAIRDRIILIGTTDSSYPDDWQTPYSKSPNAQHLTAGVFMQAQMVSQLISAVENNRPPLTTWPEAFENFWIVLWGSAGSLIILHFSRRRSKLLSHPQLLLALFLTEIGLLGLCWLFLVNACTWVPWVVSAIAPMAVASSYPFSQRLSILFFKSNA